MAFGKGPTEPLLGLWVTSPTKDPVSLLLPAQPKQMPVGTALTYPSPWGKELREGQELGVNITATLVKPKLV